MDQNIAAWMIEGGPRAEYERTRREREQLHAFRESQLSHEHRLGLIARVRELVRPAAPSEPACCPA